MTLQKLQQNFTLLALSGINFVQPFFRKMAGQLPYDVISYTIYNGDSVKLDNDIRMLLGQTEDPFAVVIRDNNHELLDTLYFVPDEKMCKPYDKVECDNKSLPPLLTN